MKQLIILPILLCIFGAASNMAFMVQDSEKKAQPPVQEQDSIEKQNEEKSIEDQFVPVDNMHHFMEYICEPSYKGLKAGLATEPENRKAWKAFKNHALVLAETSSMVADRGPKEAGKSKEWKQISLEVHKHGTALYKAAGNYESAKKHYGLMIDSCNKCHATFAEGKYQLTK